MKRVDPLDVNFAQARTLIHIRRCSRGKKKSFEWEDSYYVSSRAEEKMTPEQWLQTIRDHWGGVEIRNHWRKDACLFEDKTRSRNPNIVGSLILLRNIVLHFFVEHQDTYSGLPAFIEAVAADSKLAMSIVTSGK